MKKVKHILAIVLIAFLGAGSMQLTAQTYSITVIQPNGGESWGLGSTHLITWTDNLTKPVKVELLRNDTLFRTIVSSTTGSTYSWTIPDSSDYVGTNFKIRVTSTVLSTITNKSENVFSITSSPVAGTIQLVQPDASGISWEKGTSHLISWTGFLSSSPVKIELLRGSTDTLYRTIVSSTTGSSYTWNIPDSSSFVGNNFKVRIVSIADTTIADTSANVFSITSSPVAGTIQLVQPDASGISWAVGTSHLLSWTGFSSSSPVKIELLRGSADTLYRTIVSSTTGSTYTWDIPDSSSYVGNNFKVRIVSIADTTIADTSAHVFAMTSSPTVGSIQLVQPDVAGISWVRGTSHLISWSGFSSTSPVKIELLRGSSDTLYRTIVSSTTGSTYTWNIPDSAAYGGNNFKVRVVSIADTTIADTSANAFAITSSSTAGSIQLVQPDASGISWSIGTSHLISWTGFPTSSPVKIELLRGSTDTLYRTIVSSTTGSTYTWNIPDSSTYVGNNFKVRVSSVADTTIADTSANVFAVTSSSVAGTIQLVQPDAAGISWVKGTSHLISWTGFPTSSPVKIELLRGSTDTLYRTIVSSTTGSTYTWAIPDSSTYVGNNFKVRVSSVADTTIADTSANTFTITSAQVGGSIQLVQPDVAGISWVKGTSHLISWTGFPTSSPVKIELLRGSTDTLYRTIVSSTTGSTYTWAIPDSSTYVGTDFKVRVSSVADTTVSDTSSNTFTITSAPTGLSIQLVQPDAAGISWVKGSSHLISWTSNLAANSPVKIELLRGSTDTLYRTIVSSTTGSTYTWAIPDSSTYVGTNFKVRVSSVADTTVSDTSSNTFTITSAPTGLSIQLVQPDAAGISWVKGSSHLISWTSNLAANSPVKIELLRGSTDTLYRTIVSSTTGSTYTWAIPDSSTYVGTDFKVRISSIADTTVSDTSSNTFTITSTPTGRSIQIVQPDAAGISWVKGSSHLISWTSNLAADSPVKIELLRGSTDTLYRTIVSSTTGSTYTWTIPDSSTYVGTDFKVRISSIADTTVSDTSSNTFTITSTPTGLSIQIVQPDEAGISWVKGSSHLISWTSNLAADSPVKIELLRGSTDTLYRTIVSSTTGSTYTWAIPDSSTYVGTDFKVRISSIADTTVSDTSSNTFTITEYPTGRSIQIVQPDEAGISWVKGSSHLISWTSNLAADSPVKIELLRGATDTLYRTIVSSTTGSTYTWAIPDSSAYVGTDFKVRISSIVDTTVADTSSNAFTITAYPTGLSIQIVQPDAAGISWALGSSHLISWTSNLAANSPVKIELLRGSTDTLFRTITSSTTGSTYTWTIPDSSSYVGNNFKIRISSISDTTVSDTSSNAFALIQQPKIDIYPNPSATKVTLRFGVHVDEDVTLALYNRYNVRIMERSVNTRFTKEVHITTFDLPNGIYFLRLTSGNQVILRKLVVQH